MNTHTFLATLVASLLVTGACGDDDSGMEVIVDPDNTAPTLTDPGDLALTPIEEDALAPGDTVADILDGPTNAGDPIADADAEDQEGIVVIGADNSNGTWEYDQDGNGAAAFTAFGTVSNTAAVVLASTARIRFVPDENFNGMGGSVTFRAWDQTAGLTSGARVNIDDVGTGDPTPFSSATAQAGITVAAVNDPPRNAGGAPPAIVASEGVAADIDLSSIDVSDVDLNDGGTPPNDLSVTLTAASGGTLSATAGTTGVTLAGNNTASLTVTGTLAELNDFFDDAGGADLQFTLGVEEASDSIRIVANDGGLTGSGGEPATGVLAVVSVNASVGGAPGTLTFVDFYQNLGTVDFLADPWTAIFDPGPVGEYLYVAGANGQSITVYSRAPATSELTRVQTVGAWQETIVSGARLTSIVISPDGKNLYHTTVASGVLQTHARDPETGMLTQGSYFRQGEDGVTHLSGPTGVVVSPDGRFVYVCASLGSMVTVYSRDPSTGDLAYIPSATVVDNTEGVDGLRGPEDLTLSPDGANLYVAGSIEDKIGVFSRNTSNGTLSFLEVQEQGVESVDGLDGVSALTVSPNGDHLYAASRLTGSVAVFSRATDGTLTFESVVKDGEGGVFDLAGVHKVAVSPDGEHLYAAASYDRALLTFNRNPTTGALTFVESLFDDVPPVEELGGPAAVVVSPDGKSVYIGGRAQAGEFTSVVAFSRNTTP